MLMKHIAEQFEFGFAKTTEPMQVVKWDGQRTFGQYRVENLFKDAAAAVQEWKSIKEKLTKAQDRCKVG